MTNPAKLSLHFIGVCGKAMAPIAAALAREGWAVTGSDENAYPPMSDYLAENGVAIATPAAPDLAPAADLYIVGKRMREDNAVLARVLQEGQPYLSFPGFLREYFLARSTNAVVAGGVGKTTTSAMLTWILEYAGLEPDYLVGGLCGNLRHPARFAGSRVAVLEGDEYASCFDDIRPKFMHYAAQVVVVTNLLEDHPDLFSGPEALRQVFEDWVRTLPLDGLLVLPEHDEQALLLGKVAPCRVETVGFGRGASRRITELQLGAEGSRFTIDNIPFTLPMFGRMNVRNAVMAAVAAEALGVSLSESARALGQFRGLENRQQARHLAGGTVVFDKATHPAALMELYEALRQQFPGRRLVSLIQPRATGGRQWVYQRELPHTLAGTDLVLLTRPYEHNPRAGQTWPGGPFSVEALAAGLGELKTPTRLLAGMDEIALALKKELRPGDVLVVTLPEQALEAREAILQSVARVGD